jgi:hypothetical protein
LSIQKQPGRLLKKLRMKFRLKKKRDKIEIKKRGKGKKLVAIEKRRRSQV